MMMCSITSIGLKGMEGYRVQAEAKLITGVHQMTVIGLPDASVKESKDRVLAALHSIGCDVHSKKIVVNLAPAEQKKNGPLFDTAIAVAIMKGLNYITSEISRDTAFLGALSLDGSIHSVDGILPAVLAARRLGIKKLFLPRNLGIEIPAFKDLKCIFVSNLKQISKTLQGEAMEVSIPLSKTKIHLRREPTIDFKDVFGQAHAKRALEIAAAGGHNLLMSGPPGCGKSMLAEAFPSILPPLTNEEMLEVLSIYQMQGIIIQNEFTPPIRSPHHSASSVALIGGGAIPKPGEVSLAHRGVLFLDEMAEFSKKTLDMLRQPIESGKVVISRTHATVTYPSRFILLATANPCPCGYFNSKSHYCTCTKKQLLSYQNRISGPIYDRIDILVPLNPTNISKEEHKVRETSLEIQKRVIKARNIQMERFRKGWNNASAPLPLFEESIELSTKQKRNIQQVASKNQLSNRVQLKIVRLARTISDLNGNKEISDEAIWEAITLRRIGNTSGMKIAARGL